MGGTRGTTGDRGYGHDHQMLREQWRPTVEAAEAICPKCGEPIQPDEDWDLGHTDDRTGYTGPEHPHCNRSAGGRRGAAITNSRRNHVTIPW